MNFSDSSVIQVTATLNFKSAMSGGQGVDHPEQNAEAVRKQVESYGLQVSAFAAGNDFVVLDEAAIRAQVERMRRIAGLAKLLGASVIRTEGGSPKDAVPESRWVEAMVGCLNRCVPFAEEGGNLPCCG